METNPMSDPRRASTRTSDRIHEELRRAIITLELSPRSVLSESSLAERLKCSRTPLREALQRLAQEQLVVIEPRRAISIPPLGMTEFTELMDTMLAVEPVLIRASAASIRADELATLDRCVYQMEEAGRTGDFAGWADLDFDFHEAIARGTQNHYMEQTLVRLDRLVSRFAYLGIRRPGAASVATAEHRHVMEALRRHDADECERLIRQHITNGRERMKAVL
jgi:GntR family transcriptional regulator, rspAB operon transcriptional repressor